MPTPPLTKAHCGHRIGAMKIKMKAQSPKKSSQTLEEQVDFWTRRAMFYQKKTSQLMTQRNDAQAALGAAQDRLQKLYRNRRGYRTQIRDLQRALLQARRPQITSNCDFTGEPLIGPPDDTYTTSTAPWVQFDTDSWNHNEDPAETHHPQVEKQAAIIRHLREQRDRLEKIVEEQQEKLP